MLVCGFTLGLPAPVLRDSDVADDVLRVPLKPNMEAMKANMEALKAAHLRNKEALKAKLEALKAAQLRQFSAGYACSYPVLQTSPCAGAQPNAVTGLH